MSGVESIEDGGWAPAISIGVDTYELVDVQRRDRAAIYKGNQRFLRIGEEAAISADIVRHREMERQGFPVARLLEEGVEGNRRYFIEESLGDTYFSELFVEGSAQTKVVDEKVFRDFLDVVQRFGDAQLKTAQESEGFPELASGIHLEWLCEEFPEDAEKLQKVFEKVKSRLSEYPSVISHGDFNPHNLYPKGVIDLEDSFRGPLGYDLVSALVHIDYFPDTPADGYFARYRFSEAQRKEYLDRIDALAENAGLPKFSDHASDFEFCRAVWLLVRLQKHPNLQKFRYDLLKQRFLSD